ncbi:MAG TPA: hypothetical protein EYH43_04955 [Persephonella sp.]|nr:hypothetical protein [Hydrogenothermaceae bacterium]HIQ25313.1 hypothetical protein [Persephonella sp.]
MIDKLTIDKLTYEYKTSSRYFLFLLIPIFIIFVFVLSIEYYKDVIANRIFGVNYDNLKVPIQLKKVSDMKFIDEGLINNILDNISAKLLYIQNETTTLKETKKKEALKYKKPLKYKEPPKYKIKFIYMGVGKKYALIGNKLLTEGDITSENEKVIKIEKNKILLQGNWGRRWIYLINVQK